MTKANSRLVRFTIQQNPEYRQFIMVIELSGVQFGLKSYVWFQNRASALDLKSQVWFQTKTARHEAQLPLYYTYFEIAQLKELVSSNILLMQYWTGLKFNSSIFWEEKVRVLETKVAKCAIWYSLSFIFLNVVGYFKQALNLIGCFVFSVAS